MGLVGKVVVSGWHLEFVSHAINEGDIDRRAAGVLPLALIGI